MARKYNRDSNGRFASGGGSTSGKGSSSSRPAAVGRSGPRGGKVGTRTEQRRNAKAQQQRSQAFRSKATTGRDARAAYKSAAGAARAASRRGGASNGIRRTGGLPRPIPANGIRRTTGPRRAPLATRMNAIRTYRPVTPKGQMDYGIRGMTRSARTIKEQMPKLKGIKKQAGDIMTRIARSSARNIADSSRKDVIGEVARLMRRNEPGSIQRAAYDVIRRRAGRAAAAAARGSKPAAKAMGIYDRQLAPVLSGKPGKNFGNTIKPGPRNANPPKKKPRKPRTPKPPGSPKPKRKPRKPKS